MASNNIGLAIVVDASADTSDLEHALRQAGVRFDRFERNVSNISAHVGVDRLTASLQRTNREATRVESRFAAIRRYALQGLVSGGTFALGSAGFDLAGGVVGSLRESVGAAADYEKTSAAFEVLVGSADRASQLLGDLRKFSAESPLTFNDAAAGAKQLSSYGIATDQLVPTLKALGDVAAGTGTDLNRLTLAYGQVATAGRLTGEELRQFTEAGVPLIDALAKSLGKPEAAIKKLSESGRISFDDTIGAFKQLTEKGGKFYQMGEKYSQTYAGQVDRLTDAFDHLKRSVGQVLIEELGLKEATRDLTAFTDRITAGVGQLRPFVRAIGEIGRATAQISWEFLKAAGEVGQGWWSSAVATVPELGAFGDTISRIAKAAEGFRLDPAEARKFGEELGNAMSGLLGKVAELGREFRTEVVDPIIEAARNVGAVARTINEHVRTASDSAVAISKPSQSAQAIGEFYGLASPRNEVLSGPIAPRNASHASRLAEERTLNRLQADVVYWQQKYDARYFKDNDDARLDLMMRDRSSGLLDQSRRRLAELSPPMANDPNLIPWMVSPDRSQNFHNQRAAQFAAFGPAAAWLNPSQVVQSPQVPESTIAPELAPSPRLADLAKSAEKASEAVDHFGLQLTGQIPGYLVEMASKIQGMHADPFKQIEEAQKDLGRLWFEGLIDEDQYALAFRDRLQEITAKAAGTEFRPAPAAEFGSQEAARIIGAQQSTETATSLLSRLVELQQEEIKVAREQLRAYEQSPTPAMISLPR